MYKKEKGIVKYSVDAYLCRPWFCPKGEKDRDKSKEQINKVRKREGVVRDLAVVQEILEFRSVDSFTSEQNRQQLDSKKGTSALICRLIFPSASTDLQSDRNEVLFSCASVGVKEFSSNRSVIMSLKLLILLCLLSSVFIWVLKWAVMPLSLIKVWLTTKSTWVFIKPQEYRNIHSPSPPPLFNKANKPQNTINQSNIK